MKSTIDDFYDFESNFVNWIDRGERYEEMEKEIRELKSELSLSLTEKQRIMLGNLALLYIRKEDEAERATYKAGFKRGVALVAESVDI